MGSLVPTPPHPWFYLPHPRPASPSTHVFSPLRPQEVAEARAAAANLSDSEPKVLGTRRKVVQTTIDVSEASNGSCSVLKITTKDRPGLLVDIVRVLKDINLNVVSAEIETEGALATDEFFITYHGEPLSSPMVTLVTNSLQYYLSLAEVAKEESY
ncbi:hypothetical protein HYH03_012809 [Edaphochlamys debaryana]|uniref:ACT domain-containing protein n=1 Tax=Edaphochlamys debaryana TaxID=47281 RepID=A0A835XR96_9CHLO|nr:hypothetical protein HYH03_012809 [Edaphochlamys debaryana]|eukprot:KAG2488641.1 hypothetical protein HYH03_012809 [Edaphochlamys debaryana]